MFFKDIPLKTDYEVSISVKELYNVYGSVLGPYYFLHALYCLMYHLARSLSWCNDLVLYVITLPTGKCHQSYDFSKDLESTLKYIPIKGSTH